MFETAISICLGLILFSVGSVLLAGFIAFVMKTALEIKMNRRDRDENDNDKR